MKFLAVDLGTGDISETPIPESFDPLGGRTLTSRLIHDRVPPDCDPLGPENLLIFAPGLLAGTPLVNTGRLSVGAKSPLTGGIKESNAGGTIATALAGHGIRALIVSGKAPDGVLYHLTIDENGTPALRDAADCRGMGNYALAQRLRETWGEKNAIVSIGPAGERRRTSASIQSTDPDGFPCRAAGRGGLGAVMGAKGLKSVVVSRSGRSARPIADPETFREVAKDFARAIRSSGWSGRVLPQFGTASILASTNESGALPTRNARRGRFEGAEKIDGDALAATIERRGGRTTHRGCDKCVIHCSNVFVDESGNRVTGALEYETLWAMGAMTGIDDLDIIARLDFLCDDLGLDTMNTGVALAVAMDSGALAFGDGEAAIRAVEGVAADGHELGRLVGDGPEAVGRHFGNPRVPAVKGQSIAGYDPRAMPGMGVTYATSPMGADHTAGFIGGASGSTESLIRTSRSAQIHTAAMDGVGLCMFAQSGGMANLHRAVAAFTGKPFGPEDWREMGTRCLAAEVAFNRRAGLGEAADRLPAMFREEPLSPDYGVVPYAESDLHGTFESLGDAMAEMAGMGDDS